MEMVIKIDKAGRIVLPKNIREKYHIRPNEELIVIEQADSFLIKTKPAKKSLKSIFENGSQFDPKKVVALDLSNTNETNDPDVLENSNNET